MPEQREYDVAVLGGGLAGLTAALQLKRRRPATRILVADRREHPVREAAFKVGESTGELGAYYFTDVIGAREHIQISQLTKLGLRMFFSADGNHDISHRVELGPFEHLPVPAYQLDRGRFENFLGGECLKLGISFLDNCRVRNVALAAGGHTVTLVRGTKEFTAGARWIVDASGRAAILRRKLDLDMEVAHKASAVWFRIQDEIDLDQWSKAPAWEGRMLRGLRRFSTNHLMGPGYWVWLIPLASKVTSVGIVIDEALHSFTAIHRFEGALDWLRRHEPQCAEAVEQRRHLLLDFLTVKHFAYGARRVFSPDRWGLTGEAGVFTDALYSPGSDFIAVGNTLISDLVVRDFAGESVGERVELYNEFYLGFWFDIALRLFAGQYPILGNAQVMSAKVVWDFAVYWGIPSLLYFHDKICDVELMRSVAPQLARCQRLHAEMQDLLRAWSLADRRTYEVRQLDYVKVSFLGDLQRGLKAKLDDVRLREKIVANLEILEALAEELRERARPALEAHGAAEAAGPPPATARLSSAALLPGLERLWLEHRLETAA